MGTIQAKDQLARNNRRMCCYCRGGCTVPDVRELVELIGFIEFMEYKT
jgi:hypothetical protein